MSRRTKIAEELRSKEFESPQQRLLINLLYTASYLNGKQHILLKSFGVSVQQYNILRILRGQHPQSIGINALIDRMIEQNSNASRLVEKLRQKNLVERTTCPHDRRKVDVRITEKGLKVLAEIQPVIDQFHKDLKGVDNTEASQMNHLLNTIRELL